MVDQGQISSVGLSDHNSAVGLTDHAQALLREALVREEKASSGATGLARVILLRSAAAIGLLCDQYGKSRRLAKEGLVLLDELGGDVREYDELVEIWERALAGLKAREA